MNDALLDLPRVMNDYARKLWFDQLRQTDRALVAVGSPRACPVTEIFLAEMLGVKPFQTPPTGVGAELPFYLVWPPNLKQMESCVCLPLAQITDKTVRDKVRSNKFAAIYCNRKWYAMPMRGTAWDMYGLLVAYRRVTGQPLVALCGISGPATFATALTLRLRNDRTRPSDFTIAVTFSLKAFPRFKQGQDSTQPSLLLGG